MKYVVVPFKGDASSMTALPEPLIVATSCTPWAEACCDDPISAAITKIADIRIRSPFTGPLLGPSRAAPMLDRSVIERTRKSSSGAANQAAQAVIYGRRWRLGALP